MFANGFIPYRILICYNLFLSNAGAKIRNKNEFFLRSRKKVSFLTKKICESVIFALKLLFVDFHKPFLIVFPLVFLYGISFICLPYCQATLSCSFL